MMVFSRRIVPLGAAALTVSLAACGPKEEVHEAAPIRPVLTRVVEASDTVMFGPFAGTVEPRYQSQLGFQIPGRMVARDVTVGDLVTQGQRLAALDPVVTRFDLTRAEADLADARGQAEFDGVVTKRLAEIGQVLSAGQGVVTVARPDARDAVVDIPEALVGAMPADGVFTVALQSAPELTVRGRVRETAPFADSNTRTRRIRMTLEDPKPAFRLGATINVSLSQDVARRFLIPATAVLTEGERRSVWLVGADGRSVSRRDVTLGPQPENAGEVAVMNGLNPGDRIVVAGVHSIRDGQAVRLASAAE